MDNLFFKISGWNEDSKYIDDLIETGVYKFKLSSGNEMQLAGSHAFAIVFNTAMNRLGYCTQIVLGFFNGHIAIRNGQPSNGQIKWTLWNIINK